MVRIREALRSLGKPVYAVRGNHEKTEVLKSLSQTVDNFHHTEGRRWKEIDSTSFLLMDTNYNPRGYKSEEIERVFEKICDEAEEHTAPILVMHETLAPFEGAVPTELVEKASESFDWIFNGHMHQFDSKTLGNQNTITLPSLLPSRLVYGKYWMERYLWQADEKNWDHESRPSPFGFVIFDSDEKNIQISRIIPSKKTAELGPNY